MLLCEKNNRADESESNLGPSWIQYDPFFLLFFFFIKIKNKYVCCELMGVDVMNVWSAQEGTRAVRDVLLDTPMMI